MSLSDSVLVVGPSWVGDMVMAQSLFMTLRAEEPGVEIDVLAPPGPLPLTSRMPEVRAAIPLEVSRGTLGLRARLRASRELRRRGYDRALVIPSSFKSALAPALAGIPVRTAYRGEWRYGLINDVRTLEPARTQQNVRGYLGLAGTPPGRGPEDVPQPRLRVDAANQARLMAEHALAAATPLVALAPGASYGPSKRWPVEHFRRLAKRILHAGSSVVVVGGEGDRELGRDIVAGLSPNSEGGRRGGPARALDLCGRTSLVDALDLLGLANVTVANDSGLMHVAAAAGGHVVALYGPTPPEFSPPLTPRASVLYRGLPCSPCFARDCPLGHHRCLSDVSADEVFATVLDVLNRR